ncbi:hypothetical protein RvY_02572 [Ramazzottius varieornatus]|uniref:Fibronectin type-III domain-containing protein n=1 Tax=Ramazzottius varieornatus TaxID=947166 RepID=A0A1D1UUQ6_RAMVA|nr:hypothetical protein RvY_02572 [Ramazzottius varieornatus]
MSTLIFLCIFHVLLVERSIASPIQEIFRLSGSSEALATTTILSRDNALFHMADPPMSELSPSSSSSASQGTSSSAHKDQTASLLHPPLNLTLLTSGIDPDGKAYVQISWLPPLKSSSTNDALQRPSPFAPVDRYRITWHEQTNPKEEYRKTIEGDLTSYTIEHLLTNVHIVIDVQAFRWINDRKVRSPKATLVIRTPFRKSYSEEPSQKLTSNEGVSLPLTDSNITVNAIFFQNGLVKANLSWVPLSINPVHYVIRWYPKVCLGGEHKRSKDQPLIKPLITTTVAPSVLIYDLNFNCRYAVAIYQKMEDEQSKTKVERLRGVKHFVTPVCQEVAVVGSLHPNCPKLAPKLPGTPENVSCLFLVQQSDIAATCSWEAPSSPDQPVIGYRAMYARKMLEPNGLYGMHPFLVIDRNSVVMKVLDDDEMSFSIASLEEETEYIVHIQAISAAGFGAMTRLEFVTPKLLHSVALSQTREGRRESHTSHLFSRVSSGTSSRKHVPVTFLLLLFSRLLTNILY